MDKCSIKGCKRVANGEFTYRGYSVCSYHEKIHDNSGGKFIWKRLNIDIKAKDIQLTL